MTSEAIDTARTSTDPALVDEIVRSKRLLDRLAAGTPYAVVFGGQGADWLPALAELVRIHRLDLCDLVAGAEQRLAPVAEELAGISAFAPLTWIDERTAAESESVEADEPAALPDLLAPAQSLPGVLLTQLAALRSLRSLGLDARGALTAIGHSQGRLAVEVLQGLDETDALALARLIGAAVARTAPALGLAGDTMLHVAAPVAEVQKVIDTLPASSRLVVRVRNGRRSCVVSGPTVGLERLRGALGDDVNVDLVKARAAFHHPELAAAAALVESWAEVCGLDPVLARRVADQVLVDEVDWPTEVAATAAAGARWLLDLGPENLASGFTAPLAEAWGLGVIAPATAKGLRALTVVGAAPRRSPGWASYAPQAIRTPDGRLRAQTRFTQLTGRSPILLAGMTPTTVDPAIVAAAANAGHWAELAGGGQVSESIFGENVERLGALLEPGRTAAFNALYLDPYLWRLQLGSQRLVQRARAAGAAFDAVVVTAGVPELDEAVRLVSELQGLGIEDVVFKPGTVSQIKAVLKIADEVAPANLIVQIEGGKAGGHHSWEDLDDLLLATYAELRRRDNVVVCVGGGIGTPADAARYISGDWSLAYGEPAMPLDGVLVGTAAMACLEATTSPQVKQLLVETPGTPAWVRAGEVSGGVTSGRSQLGADIHEIDNAAARTGRLLDEVAGDADAVAARRDEIIAALSRTAKPYFGDVETMTYAAWLSRFLDLAGSPQWLDVSLRDRFHAMVQRAEARLCESDHGLVPTLFENPDDVEDGVGALARLLTRYPAAAEVVLHPVDVAFFVEVCGRAGKPVPFVPVIDANVRKYYRSDSLWQAHDARYPADAVCVIPGPVSVAGITRVDEPVAALLDRFEAAVVEAVMRDEVLPIAVSGRRVSALVDGPLGLVLAAPDAVWAGRTVINPVRRLGEDWRVVEPGVAEHVGTGSTLTASGDRVALRIPLGTDSLALTLVAGEAVATGAAPVVENPAAAMRTLMGIAAGTAERSLLTPERSVLTLEPSVAAEHAAATAVSGLRADVVPDAVVGLAWPAVFGALAERDDVVEGMLDLVHLDHAITSDHSAVTSDGSAVTSDRSAEARIVEIADTEVGRVVTVDVTVGSAMLTERFAIRGRTGTTPLTDPAIAGGVGDFVSTARRTRARATATAPSSMAAFANATGDHNPIHTSLAAASLAGLGGPIVHGMWLSATAQRVLVEATDREILGWTARFLAPVKPGSAVDFRCVRVGVIEGDEIVEVQAVVVDDEGSTLVMAATARLVAPRTAYVFPGQGIQRQGMGMDGYSRSVAAREVWDRADKHTRSVLGFSVLRVVRENPTEMLVDGTWHRHPDGVLFLTQFTQVAMAVLAAAQMAELLEAGVAADDAIIAGHSVGEYNALAAVSDVLSLEAVVEIVYRRGSVMHTLVPRDAEGRSDYRLAAIRPAQCGIGDDEVGDFIESVATASGEFLQIANHNLRGSQYAIAGTVAGLEALEAEIECRRAAFGGKAAFVLVPGIDVPFHSRVLAGGVDDFRAKLDELLPSDVDPAILLGRYVPNLVARPFALDAEFLESILEVAPSEQVRAVLADFGSWAERPAQLCRLVLIELLAWQFASPVRWIETQDLLFADVADGGLGVTRLVEVGVGSAPTLANLASQTLKLPEVRRTLSGPVEVLNVERDATVVFARDEDAPEPDDAEPSALTPEPSVATAEPSVAAGPRTAEVADLPYSAADATRLLLAWWSKIRPDQLGDADSIESLTDGASSRRNQLLVDLGGELSLGAIDGAAEAPVAALTAQVTGLARAYKPFGPVLSAAIGDHLKKVLGPVGARQATIADRVTGVWQLGPGWASHVVAEVAAATREGASVRGGDLADGPAPKSATDLDATIDRAVHAVAARRGISVSMPTADASPVVDAAAAAALTGDITAALLESARVVLAQLSDGSTVTSDGSRVTSDGSAEGEAQAEAQARAQAQAVLARVEAELGSDWMKLTAPAFDARRAVLLDDRWASARSDLARIAAGEDLTVDLTGAGPAVAAQARWYGLDHLADQAESHAPGAYRDEVAVVTGAGPNSIAEAMVVKLLAGGATVVATTSSLSSERLTRFRELYAQHARVGAALWVVPANMASYQDVDALVEWVTHEQTRRLGPKTEVVKPALHPTLLFPFAAGPVTGDLGDGSVEGQARILLWSVERLIAATWGEQRLHVVLPGSPNRGRFGGDGAYGEMKAALDAVVAKWHVEPWASRVTLAHAVIGWVAGTGLMGGNDPLVAAARSAAVRVWSAAEMADALLELCSSEAREAASEAPLHLDLAEGLADVNLKELAKGLVLPKSEVAEESGIPALPPSPAHLAEAPAPLVEKAPLALEDMVVIVGAGELGPWGSSRTRFEAEIGGLSAAGVLELAWSTGLVRWDEQARGWYDVESGDPIAEHEIRDRYHDVVTARCGIREYEDDGRLENGSAPLLVGVYLDKDLTFTVDTEAEARAFHQADSTTVIAQTAEGWNVTRKAGTEIRVPRRIDLTRTVGGQIPTGFDPAVWGVPAEMIESVDRLALYNLVCTVDAFLGSGFTPAELMRWIHPARVANTQGTGMGGMTSMQSLYLDTLLGESVANDLLQEALPNVVAAHVMQTYVGGYGAMVHPVAACATTAVSIEEGVDKIRLGKADFVVAGGFDDLSNEGIIGFGAMSATADTADMRAQGIADDRFSRANDRRRGGFVEGQGGGTILLARGDLAARMGLPVLGVVAYAASFADGIHSSIPAPGLGALAAGLGRDRSPLATALRQHGLTPDDVAVVSKHDTSTAANDPNESELHERLATAIGRSTGNPLHVISQKSLTGHAKGGAAAFQVIGLCQVLRDGVIPANRSLDCVDPALAEYPHLVWHRTPLEVGPIKAGLVTSLGFGHVAGLLAIAHPEVFVAALPDPDAWRAAARKRQVAGGLRLARTMLGEPGFVRRFDRRLGEDHPREREASLLLDASVRLGEDGVFACQ